MHTPSIRLLLPRAFPFLLIGGAVVLSSCSVLPTGEAYDQDPAFAGAPPRNRFGYQGTQSPNERRERTVAVDRDRERERQRRDRAERADERDDRERGDTPPRNRPTRIVRDVNDTTVNIEPPEEKVESKPVVKDTPAPPPEPKETPAARPPSSRDDLPYGSPVVGRKGNAYSPYAPDKGYVDVDGFARGTRVKCPYTGKDFRVP